MGIILEFHQFWTTNKKGVVIKDSVIKFFFHVSIYQVGFCIDAWIFYVLPTNFKCVVFREILNIPYCLLGQDRCLLDRAG